jgi:hypothetical protein
MKGGASIFLSVFSARFLTKLNRNIFWNKIIQRKKFSNQGLIWGKLNNNRSVEYSIRCKSKEESLGGRVFKKILSKTSLGKAGAFSRMVYSLYMLVVYHLFYFMVPVIGIP